MTPAPLTIVFACLMLLLPGCNGTGLQGSGGKKEKSEKPSAEKEETLGTESGSKVDDEDDVADRPVEVSGAMLTCASVQIPGVDSGFDRYGCVIEKDSTKIPRDQFDAEYSVATLPDQTPIAGAVIDVADQISLWHVFILIPTGKADTFETTAMVRWKNAAGTTPQVLKVVVSKGSGLNALRFGMNNEFHLGNNDYSGSACKPRINTVALFGPLLSISFTIGSDGTKTAFHVNGICGLDYDDVAEIRVLRGATVIKTVKLKTTDTDIIFGIGTLTAGSYTLELESLEMKDKAGDHDDFIIGDITVVSDKPISGELPVPSTTP